FPSPDITNPNIRFEQAKSLPREMTRTDSMPLRYEQDEQGRLGENAFHTKVRETGKAKEWNLAKLRSREDPLVIFTLISQGVIGAFLMMFLAPLFGFTELSIENYPLAFPITLFVLLGLETFALALSTMHLGKPHRFYRAFNNLRYSPVSREVASIAVFFNLFAAYTVLTVFSGVFSFLPEGWLSSLQLLMGWGAVVAGPIALYFMHSIYRIKARPFWNHWQVLSSFYGSMLSLGALVVLLAFASVDLFAGQSILPMVNYIALPLIAGLLIEGFGLIRHRSDLIKQGGEGAASLYEQSTTFGKTYLLRNALMLSSLIVVIILSLSQSDGVVTYVLWMFEALTILSAAFIGRSLFYVLVIPTTMPGAFFWRNKGFQEHARETGLAEMEQVGVLPDIH
ncbi:MAG: dimethyl sulfoxide reductase anchor subunit, partial [Gammaproteobacteria bacterium]|nr:dimethyl sulfoxide reductase anchor subunit [Gammaproteobacteria bacterium]